MSLTEISYYLRKYFPVTAIIMVFLILIYFVIKFYLAYLTTQRVAPVVVSPIFNKISAPRLHDPQDTEFKQITFPETINFSLDTIEGRPIIATSTAHIYFLPQSPTRFGYVQNAYLMAKTIGFDPESQYTLQNKNIIFKDDFRNLTIDISNFNFVYKYDYENNPGLFDSTYIPDEPIILEQAREILRNIGRYPEELAQGKQQVILLHYDSNTKEFVKVDTVAEANVVEVDYFRPDIDDLSVVTPKFPYSQNYTVMVFNTETNQPTVLKSQIKFFEKEDQKVGVYPLKTGEQAYEDLKNKKGIIVSAGTGTSDITIKTMGLSYFDPDYYQEFLQPVYTFLGDNGFIAYVPAVVDEYIASDEAQISP